MRVDTLEHWGKRCRGPYRAITAVLAPGVDRSRSAVDGDHGRGDGVGVSAAGAIRAGRPSYVATVEEGAAQGAGTRRSRGEAAASVNRRPVRLEPGSPRRRRAAAGDGPRLEVAGVGR